MTSGPDPTDPIEGTAVALTVSGETSMYPCDLGTPQLVVLENHLSVTVPVSTTLSGLQVVLPFSISVPLGTLPAGPYTYTFDFPHTVDGIPSSEIVQESGSFDVAAAVLLLGPLGVCVLAALLAMNGLCKARRARE
jgi:hypothetical protein